jgi:arsenate reductase
MAEGLTNHFFADRWDAFSAGTEKTMVKPFAIEALKDLGIDISHHKSKKLNIFTNDKFDLVVTVCDSAKEACPNFLGAKKTIHVDFQDPSDTKGSDEKKFKAYINIRNEIKIWLDDSLQKFE